MILSIFILLLFISIFFIVLGFSLKGKADIFQFIGFAFLFLLGIAIMPGMPTTLEYQSGANITDIGSVTVVTPTYVVYNSFTYGFYIAIAGGLGFIVSLLLRRSETYNDD